MNIAGSGSIARGAEVASPPLWAGVVVLLVMVAVTLTSCLGAPSFDKGPTTTTDIFMDDRG